MKMLREQIANNNSRQPLRVGLPERSHVSSTREEEILDVNKSTSQDKGKRKVAEVPIFDNAYDRPANEAPQQTGHPNVFDRIGGRVTQREARPKYWAKRLFSKSTREIDHKEHLSLNMLFTPKGSLETVSSAKPLITL